MTVTCSDIVEGAYLELNAISAGRNMTGAQAARGMTLLGDLLGEMAGMAIGAKLRDAAYDTDATLAINTRAVVSGHAAALTLTLPAEPQDGSRVQVLDAGAAFAARPVTIARNGRLLEGSEANVTANTNGYSRTWMYRADLADWRVVSDLALADEFPYPRDTHSAFKLILAFRLAPRDGIAFQTESQVALNRAVTRLRTRYRQRVSTPVDSALLRLSTQTYDRSYSSETDL